MKLTYNETEVQRALEQATWQSWTPDVWHIVSGPGTREDFYSVDRAVYLRHRNIVFYTLSVTVTSSATGSHSRINFTVPHDIAYTDSFSGVGRQTSGGGILMVAVTAAAAGDPDISFFKFNSTSLSVVSGDKFTVSGSYLI